MRLGRQTAEGGCLHHDLGAYGICLIVRVDSEMIFSGRFSRISE
jgi:hypothetical protein